MVAAVVVVVAAVVVVVVVVVYLQWKNVLIVLASVMIAYLFGEIESVHSFVSALVAVRSCVFLKV